MTRIKLTKLERNNHQAGACGCRGPLAQPPRGAGAGAAGTYPSAVMAVMPTVHVGVRLCVDLDARVRRQVYARVQDLHGKTGTGTPAPPRARAGRQKRLCSRKGFPGNQNPRAAQEPDTIGPRVHAHIH